MSTAALHIAVLTRCRIVKDVAQLQHLALLLFAQGMRCFTTIPRRSATSFPIFMNYLHISTRYDIIVHAPLRRELNLQSQRPKRLV